MLLAQTTKLHAFWPLYESSHVRETRNISLFVADLCILKSQQANHSKESCDTLLQCKKTQFIKKFYDVKNI
jgi:hypothetical protein